MNKRPLPNLIQVLQHLIFLIQVQIYNCGFQISFSQYNNMYSIEFASFLFVCLYSGTKEKNQQLKTLHLQ